MKTKTKMLSLVPLLGALSTGTNASEMQVFGELELNSDRMSSELILKKPMTEKSYCDLYNLNEKRLDTDFSIDMARIGCSYQLTDNLNFGVASRHASINNSSWEQNFGISSQIKGNIGKDGFGALNLRYFPKIDRAEAYGFYQSDLFSADILAAQNTQSNSGFVKPTLKIPVKNLGLDIDNLHITAEAQYNIKTLEKDYSNIGLLYSFKF